MCPCHTNLLYSVIHFLRARTRSIEFATSRCFVQPYKCRGLHRALSRLTRLRSQTALALLSHTYATAIRSAPNLSWFGVWTNDPAVEWAVGNLVLVLNTPDDRMPSSRHVEHFIFSVIKIIINRRVSACASPKIQSGVIS